MLKFQNNNTITIATFEDFILTAFVIIDELYFRYVPDAVSKRRNVFNAKLSDSEIITISICGELIGVDSENAWFSFVKKNYHHLFPGIGSRSRFNRTRRALLQTTELIRQKMFSAFAMPYSRYLVIDSFPLQYASLEEPVIVSLFAAMEPITASVLRKKRPILASKYMP